MHDISCNSTTYEINVCVWGGARLKTESTDKQV